MVNKTPWYKRLFFQEDTAVQDEKNQFSSAHLIPIGNSGTEIFSGYYSEEYLSNLRGTQAADAYDKMRRSDAKVKMVLNAVKNPIKAATWSVESADDSPEAQRQKELIEHILFNDMDKPWSQFLGEALSYVDFGFSVFEVTNKIVLNHSKFGSYNGIRSFGFRSQRKIERWNLDPNGKLLSVEEQAHGDVGKNVTIPGQYLVVFTLDKEGDNYEGISGLRACFGPWSRKQVYLKLMAIGIEKSAVPTPVASVPEGKENSTQFDNMIEVLKAYTSHQSNYITKPVGWEITFLQNPFDAEKIKEAIAFENQEIALAFLANFLELGMNGNGGSYSLGTDLSDFFLSGIEHVAQNIANVINQDVIQNLIKMNFGPQDSYPKLRVSGISDKIGKEFSDMVRGFVDSKVITPDDDLEAEMRRRIGLPKASLQGRREVQSVPGIPTLNEQSGKPVVALAEPKKKDLITLAEKTPKQLVKASSKPLLELMQEHLRGISESMIDSIIKKFEDASVVNEANAIKDTSIKGLVDYKAAVEEYMAKVSRDAIEQAKKESPKSVREKYKFAEIDDLPPAVKKRIKAQTELLVNTQVSDLEKNVSFQYLSSQPTTDSADLLRSDLTEAAEDFITGPSLLSGAPTLIADAVAVARHEYFYSDEVFDEVESFTFVNGDPVSPICQDLAGTVFSKDDPGMARYSPPLHHQCASYLSPNFKGAKNPPLTDGGLKPSSKSLDKYVTLAESKKPAKKKGK